MKNKTRAIIGFGILLCMLFSAQTAMGWSINPAKWTLYHVEDYEIEPYVWPIELTNDGDSPITVKLSVKEPEKLYDGYEVLPDFDWVEINETTMEIPANSKMRTDIYINIENESANYGKNWEFWIFADQTAGAGNIQTDYNCRWMVKTPERYVPIWERPGYIHWPTVAAIAIAGMGGIAAIIIWAKNSKKNKKKTPTKAKHVRAGTNGNTNNAPKEDTKKSTTIKFQKS